MSNIFDVTGPAIEGEFQKRWRNHGKRTNGGGIILREMIGDYLAMTVIDQDFRESAAKMKVLPVEAFVSPAPMPPSSGMVRTRLALHEKCLAEHVPPFGKYINLDPSESAAAGREELEKQLAHAERYEAVVNEVVNGLKKFRPGEVGAILGDNLRLAERHAAAERYIEVEGRRIVEYDRAMAFATGTPEKVAEMVREGLRRDASDLREAARLHEVSVAALETLRKDHGIPPAGHVRDKWTDWASQAFGRVESEVLKQASRAHESRALQLEADAANPRMVEVLAAAEIDKARHILRSWPALDKGPIVATGYNPLSEELVALWGAIRELRSFQEEMMAVERTAAEARLARYEQMRREALALVGSLWPAQQTEGKEKA